MTVKWIAAALLASVACPALAGEVPLYQPAPGWVIETPYAAGAAPRTDGPSLEIFDDQQRIADGQLWHYNDTAVRMASPEMLAQFATIALPWIPDQGDIIIHELSIRRGTEKIDLLASRKFEVLRREQNLEQLELTGILTATTPVEGLRVGDVLRVRFSVTNRDEALRGNVDTATPVLAAPMRLGAAKLRVLWPAKNRAKWQFLATGITANPVRKGEEMELILPLPAPKQPEVPDDAPARYKRPPLFELSTFADWPEVSRTLAPLYATDGLIAPGGPLAEEVARIKAAERTPLRRTQMALQLVQDQVRYLAVFMNGGNLVPQKPADTWRLRYGDCKAKTLLLLALLRAMDIKAEPVAANIGLGDLVAVRIPSVAAFNHVFVRAEIDGQQLWLDGTGGGSRLEDINDTPALGNVLPLRAEGAALLKIATHRNARPAVDLTVEADESSSVDLPSIYDATAVLRGAGARGLILATANLDAAQQKEAVRQFFTQMIGEGQFSGASLKVDAEAATVTLKVRGATATQWGRDERQTKRRLSRTLGNIAFEPNRAKAEWAAIPVATADPSGFRYRLKLRLPDGGKGYTIEGAPNATETLAGTELARTIEIKDGVLTLEERLDATGAEIPVDRIAAERDRVTTAKSREPKLVAPDNATKRWNLAKAAPGATQLASVMALYGRAVVENPTEAEPYLSRASLTKGIGDYKAALADYTKAIAIAPDLQTYLLRASVYRALGNLPAALADAQKARELDPSSGGANLLLAEIRAERGDLAGAVAALDERIALGGENSDDYRQAKAGLIGEYGDPAEALQLVQQLMAKKPGSPALLNASCWIKGTRAVMLDTALKDCTSAIELSSSTFQALDSRSVVWFRMGKYEEALQDLNAVIDQVPNLAPSRYMRSLVLAKLKRPEESAADLTIARQIDPRVNLNYDRWGITR